MPWLMYNQIYYKWYTFQPFHPGLRQGLAVVCEIYSTSFLVVSYLLDLLAFCFRRSCITGTRNVPLSTESPHSPVTTSDILGVHVVEIPPQTPKGVLPRLQQQVELASGGLVDPFDVPLHVVLRVARHDNRRLGLQQHGDGLDPLVRAGGVAQARVEEHEAVEVRVVRVEVAGLVDGVVVINDSADLHVLPRPLNDGSEGVARRPLRERELIVAVCHGLRADEDEVEAGAREQVGELDPGVAREGRLCTRAEDKEADWGRLKTQVLDLGTTSRPGRV